MNLDTFIIIGENIHCTRSVKRDGKRMTRSATGEPSTNDVGTEAVLFRHNGESMQLPVPTDWESISPEYANGKCKHVALAVCQMLNGSSGDARLGEQYLDALAAGQIAAGASYLDVNVDEYSIDSGETAAVMAALVTFLTERHDIPLSIDSSSPNVMAAGLETCNGRTMVNSVSLERESLLDVVAKYDADVIVSAAGRTGLPSTVEERLTNFREIVGMLEERGVSQERMHLDPLVLPVSTDSNNGKTFLEATAQAAQEFPAAHLNGGFSNVSFGMPSRKLLNQVFIWLCVEAGAGGGIIDPVATPVKGVAELDADAEPFQLARAVLVGDDMFGMEYIGAYREGRLKAPQEPA
ncbi:MAG: dihydropteroate synthase [Lentisphaeria bacterium]|jgi:5-methyltetrahydrofolate--homocysteine methyltransferase|nr:dihydropteroate synthase [Lentisphaeria bacterium]